MNRRKFLQRLGLGLGAAVIVPKVFESEIPVTGSRHMTGDTLYFDTSSDEFIGYWKEEGKISGILNQMHERGNVFSYYTDQRGAKAFNDAMEDLLEEYKVS